jgi:hypothetical protein
MNQISIRIFERGHLHRGVGRATEALGWCFRNCSLFQTRIGDGQTNPEIQSV